MRNREGRVLESGIDRQCDRCGYQIATARALPPCPMCGAIDRRLIARAGSDPTRGPRVRGFGATSGCVWRW